MLMDHGSLWWSTTNGWGLTALSIGLIEQDIALTSRELGLFEQQALLMFREIIGADYPKFAWSELTQTGFKSFSTMMPRTGGRPRSVRATAIGYCYVGSMVSMLPVSA